MFRVFLICLAVNKPGRLHPFERVRIQSYSYSPCKFLKAFSVQLQHAELPAI